MVEFTHMVMGPTCGLVLADLGPRSSRSGHGRATHAPPAGRWGGLLPMFNRNKKSIAIDLRNPKALAVARKLAASADVVAQNFKPGVMTKYGLDYAALSQINPRLIYVRPHRGLSGRAVRAPHGAGRGGADDGRPGLHDRPPWRPAARRQQRERHHGRHVWRDWRHGRADAARHHRARAEVDSACSRTTCSWSAST